MHENIKKSGSTAYQKIDKVLAQYEWYQQYKAGKISREHYLAHILSHQQELFDKGLNEDQLHLSSRLPLSSDAFVAKVLQSLYDAQTIPAISYPVEEFHAYFQEVEASFLHDGYTTYIFPEEAQLIFALTHIMQPKRMLFLGSYYGYWAAWAIPALKKYHGEAYLLDIDSQVLDLSKINMQHLGGHQQMHYVCGDAIEFCQRERLEHDFIVLDAEGPKTGPDPDLLDKAIYYPMLEAATHSLTESGSVLFHNILLNNPIADTYFENKINDNFNQFRKLLPFIEQNFTHWSHYDSTEGVGFAGCKRGKQK